MIKNKIIGLFLSFFKIGLFTFGGGYAMIALIEREFVENKKWITHDEFMDIISIAESTPGPIAINSATYIGYKVGKVAGSFFATTAVCIPSFIIIYIISLFFDAFLKIDYVDYAFRGIQVCVGYLILSAGIKMLKKLKKSTFNLVIFSSVTLLVIITSLLSIKLSSILLIVIGEVLGITSYIFGTKNNKEVK